MRIEEAEDEAIVDGLHEIIRRVHIKSEDLDGNVVEREDPC